MSKIFELCILNNFDNVVTSNRQFGFKKNVGCQHSLHSVRKVVNFFNTKGSTVNIGVINLKKNSIRQVFMVFYVSCKRGI